MKLKGESKMKRITLPQWAVVLALVATLGMNFLANALPLNGNTTGELSDQFPVLITPAGYAFAIWGLIYLGLALFAFWQLLPAQRDNPMLHEIRAPFLLSSIANIAWIGFWHFEWVLLSLGAMLVLLGSLLMIYQRIRRHRPQMSRVERWLVQRPFSLYLGWITVATTLNVAVTLYDAGWRGGAITPTVWSVLLLLVVTGLAFWITGRGRDPVYGAVVIWALVGIAAKQSAVAPVALMASLAALLVGIAAIRAAPLPGRAQAIP